MGILRSTSMTSEAKRGHTQLVSLFRNLSLLTIKLLTAQRLRISLDNLRYDLGGHLRSWKKFNDLLSHLSNLDFWSLTVSEANCVDIGDHCSQRAKRATFISSSPVLIRVGASAPLGPELAPSPRPKGEHRPRSGREYYIQWCIYVIIHASDKQDWKFFSVHDREIYT